MFHSDDMIRSILAMLDEGDGAFGGCFVFLIGRLKSRFGSHW